MEEKIDGMDKDSLVATLCTCNEKVHALKQVYSETVSPANTQLKACRETLTEYMTSNGMECVQVNEDLYARLYQRVGTGESLTPMLFMDIMNSLTPTKFIETAKRIDVDRQVRKEEWLKDQRKKIEKELESKRSKPKAKKRLTKRLKIESMAAAAEELGSDAASHVDDILSAASKPVYEDDEEASFPTHDAYVDYLVSKVPFPEPEVKYTGKNKAYAQRPPPAFGRALTTKEMFVEVLYTLLRDRHKPLKPVVTITSRPGKVSTITTVAPKSVFDNIRTYVELRSKIVRLQTENRNKRREYMVIMDRCKDRLQPLLTTKYEANMPTPEGLRAISVEVKRTEKVDRRLGMWDIGCMMDDVTSQVLSSTDAFDSSNLSTVLTEETLSHVIREILKKMSDFTTEHTRVVESVRLRRGRAKDEDDDSSDDGDSSDDDDDELL